MQITSVTIGGFERISDVLLESLSVSRETGGQISTCEFDVVAAPSENAIVGAAIVGDAFVGDAIGVAAEVVISAGANRVYAGHIARLSPRRIREHAFLYQVTCQDYTRELDSVVVSELFTSQWDSQIIVQLLATYLPSVSAASVAAVGVIDSLELKGVTLRQALEKVVERTGAEWYLDYNRTLNYFAAGSRPAAFGFSDAPDQITRFPFKREEFSFSSDFSSAANRVTVFGKETDAVNAFLSVAVIAGGDDGYLRRESTVIPPVWPPNGAITAFTAGTAAWTDANSTGYYFLEQALLRFNTSAIPDDATVLSATLKLWVNNIQSTNSPQFGIEYYPASSWPIDYLDHAYQSPATTDAVPYRSFSGITVNAYNSFPLSNLGSINKAGYTGFRAHVKVSSAPTGNNGVSFLTFENGSGVPVLEVAYTQSVPGPSAVYDHTISQSLYGVFEKTVVDRGIQTAGEAALRAQYEATRYALPLDSITLSWRQDGIEIGQAVPMEFRDAGIDGSYVVKKLNLKWITPTLTHYTAELGTARPDLVKLLRQLAIA